MIDIDALEALAKAATSGMPGDRIPFALHAMDPEGMLALIAEVRALREDKARLDWLDTMNAALNRHCGTAYQWKVILSHHITRLMTGRQWAGFVGDIDLNDSQSGDGSFAGCREAIDAARKEKA